MLGEQVEGCLPLPNSLPFASLPLGAFALTAFPKVIASGTGRQTGLNAETQRARRNAEAKSFFFLLSLRSSANLSVSALILRSLREYWSTAVQGVELAKGTALTHPSARPPFSLWVLCVLCG